MKTLLKIIFASVISMLFVIGCDKYDDSKLSGRIDGLEDRVTTLEELVGKLQTDVTNFSKLVKAFQEETRIEKIIPFDDGTGYKIILADGKGELEIKNGKDGEKPVIDVKEESGILYWAADGEFVLVDGNKVPATIAPEFRVNNGQIEVRFNGGEWAVVEGSQSIGIIKDIHEDETGENVIFVFSDGREDIIIPKVQAFRLNIDIEEAGIMAGTAVSIPYTITSGDAETKVAAIAGSGYTAVVIGNSQSGRISVTAPETVPAKADILVVAVNGKGVSSSKILSFEQGELRLAKDTYVIGAQGGEIQVEIKTNLEWSTSIDPDPKNAWLTVVQATKALRDEVLTLSAAEYIDGTEARSAEVVVRYGNTSQTITVTQLHTAVISGGSADLDTFEQAVHARNIIDEGTSAAGWTFKNCLIYGPTQWDVIATKTVVLSGSTSKVGSLTSPLLEGGCGILTIRYGGHIAPTVHKIKFKVDVKNASGDIIKTEIVGAEDGMYEQKKQYESNIDVNMAGGFSVVLTNLCPSGGSLSAGPKDAVTLLAVSWTGYSE